MTTLCNYLDQKQYSKAKLRKVRYFSMDTSKITPKEKVLGFMDNLKREKEKQDQIDDFKNSAHYKMRVMGQRKADARDACLNNICCDIYKNAIPLNDDYKNAYANDIDAAWKDFIAKRCPEGIEFYIREGLKKGSPFAKKVLEAVDELVNDEYRDKEIDPDKYDPEELVFRSTDDIQKKIDVINADLNTEELSQAINNNVKKTIVSEINRAKSEKEKIANLEKELANDVRVTTPEDVDNALEAAGVTEKKFYEPGLFEAINIGMVNTLTPKYESGDLQEVYLYGALDEYRECPNENESQFASVDDLAFVESIKELTALNTVKALKLESFNPFNISDMAHEYASRR